MNIENSVSVNGQPSVSEITANKLQLDREMTDVLFKEWQNIDWNELNALPEEEMMKILREKAARFDKQTRGWFIGEPMEEKEGDD